MCSKYDSSDGLQPAGSGLPIWERLALKGLLKSTALVLSDRVALTRFRRDFAELDRLANEDESYDVFHPLLIPRVLGIEDSSRKWSVMMVLDHLCMTHRDMLTAITALMDGVTPRGEIDVALYKPSPDVGFDVLDRFRMISNEYVMTIESLIESRGSLQSSVTYQHPWFGRLNAHQWHCLAVAHQQIHRRQTQKIVAMLGVT